MGYYSDDHDKELLTCLLEGRGSIDWDPCHSPDGGGPLWHRLADGASFTSQGRTAVRRGNTLVWSTGRVELINSCACWRTVCISCGMLRFHVDRDPHSFVVQAREPSEPHDDCPSCKAKPELVRLSEVK